MLLALFLPGLDTPKDLSTQRTNSYLQQIKLPFHRGREGGKVGRSSDGLGQGRSFWEVVLCVCTGGGVTAAWCLLLLSPAPEAKLLGSTAVNCYSNSHFIRL